MQGVELSFRLDNAIQCHGIMSYMIMPRDTNYLHTGVFTQLILHFWPGHWAPCAVSTPPCHAEIQCTRAYSNALLQMHAMQAK
jgi:hypothetical protein